MIQKFQDADILKGLLVFSPFFLSVTSLLIGLKLGLIVFSFILLLSPIIFFSRKLFVYPQQHTVIVLIISASWILLMRMLLNVEDYSLLEKISLFLPLLLINSLVLSVSESILTMSDFKSVLKRLFKTGTAILIFFIALGFLQESLSRISLFNSPAGFFFLSGFIFAAINFFNRKKLTS